MSWQHILKMVNVEYKYAVVDDIIDFLKNDFANELGITHSIQEGYGHMNPQGLTSIIKKRIKLALGAISKQPRLNYYNIKRLMKTTVIISFSDGNSGFRQGGKLWFNFIMQDDRNWEFSYYVNLSDRLKEGEITPEDVERVVNKVLNMAGIIMEHPLTVENINRYLEE